MHPADLLMKRPFPHRLIASSFVRNFALAEGGGVQVYLRPPDGQRSRGEFVAGKMQVDSCLFAENYAGSVGGGMSFQYHGNVNGHRHHVQLTRFTRNRSGHSGGGWMLRYANNYNKRCIDVRVDKSHFDRNKALVDTNSPRVDSNFLPSGGGASIQIQGFMSRLGSACSNGAPWGVNISVIESLFVGNDALLAGGALALEVDDAFDG